VTFEVALHVLEDLIACVSFDVAISDYVRVVDRFDRRFASVCAPSRKDRPNARFGVIALCATERHEGAEGIEEILLKSCSRKIRYLELGTARVPDIWAEVLSVFVVARDLGDCDGRASLQRNHDEITLLGRSDKCVELADVIRDSPLLRIGIRLPVGGLEVRSLLELREITDLEPAHDEDGVLQHASFELSAGTALQNPESHGSRLSEIALEDRTGWEWEPRNLGL
jgi:hypothetical protein